jgi:hypothetical protein
VQVPARQVPSAATPHSIVARGEYVECRPAETAGRACDVPRSQSSADWAAVWDFVVRRKPQG